MEKTQISDLPTSVQFDFESGEFHPYLKVENRRVSDLAPVFSDQQAVRAILESGDRLVYEIRYQPFQTSNSDMALGVTRIFPGKVGREFHMTKGHFHERADQPEIYFCIQGEGYLLLETHQGEFRTEAWSPGTITHIPPMYAHRVVNTGSSPLFFVATYHLSAGHDYGPILESGFAKILVEENGQAVLQPNPRRRR
ncbi:MAG: hypothetical protein A2Z16_16350 [Chloroflexi bacterium RBG_16_54_18]|nr:MAG: hypothetical protein A2Z16_16350 [Chloroflexi bacterium RBG_16_54_18]